MKTIQLILFLSTAYFVQSQEYTFVELTPDSLHNVMSGAFAHGDIDNDGDIDFIMAGDSNYQWGGGNCTALYLNDGLGNFEKRNPFSILPVQEATILMQDFDGDNDLDLYVTGFNDSSLSNTSRMYRNDGNYTFTYLQGNYLPVGPDATIDFSDVDNDGDVDAVASYNYSGPYTEIFYNDGSGDFTYSQGSSGIFYCCGISEFADVDGDGDQDILTSGNNPIPAAHTRIYLNDGNGNFTISNGFTMMNTFWTGGFLDMDNDGDMDILLAHVSYGPSKIFINDGAGNFTEVVTPAFQGITAHDIKFGDINADGRPDILLQGIVEGTLERVTRIYTNNWNLGFIESTTNIPLIQGQQSSMDLLNIDGDPYLELLLSAQIGGGVFRTALYDNVSFLGQEETSLENVSIYPNPNNGTFQLVLPSITSKTTLQIFNLKGQEVHSEELTNLSSTIEFKGVSGAYTAVLTNNNRVVTEKLFLL